MCLSNSPITFDRPLLPGRGHDKLYQQVGLFPRSLVKSDGIQGEGVQTNSAQDNGVQPDSTQDDGGQPDSTQDYGVQTNSAQDDAVHTNSTQDDAVQTNSAQDDDVQPDSTQTGGAQGHRDGIQSVATEGDEVHTCMYNDYNMLQYSDSWYIQFRNNCKDRS